MILHLVSMWDISVKHNFNIDIKGKETDKRAWKGILHLNAEGAPWMQLPKNNYPPQKPKKEYEEFVVSSQLS